MINEYADDIRRSVGSILQQPESPQSFGAYKKHSGELDSSSYEGVMQYSSSDEDSKKAFALLSKNPMGMLPDNATVKMAAKLVGFLKNDPRSQHSMWLLTEAMLLLGRF
jgi:hypothetical protein